MAVTDLVNVWYSVETACTNDLAEVTTCAELDNDIRAFMAMFPGLEPMLRFLLDSYPSAANTEVHQTIRQALEE